MNWKGLGQQYCLIMKYFPSICLDELEKKKKKKKKNKKNFFRIVKVCLKVKAPFTPKDLKIIKMGNFPQNLL